MKFIQKYFIIPYIKILVLKFDAQVKGKLSTRYLCHFKPGAHQPAGWRAPGFLKSLSFHQSMCVSVCVCVCLCVCVVCVYVCVTPKITCGMILTLSDWLNNCGSFSVTFMALAVDIFDRRGPSIEMCR